MAVCYRHPNRETGVSCSNCGKPICPDCMTATPVGMRCPDCSRQKTPVRTMRNIYAEPTATYILIGICVLLYLGTWISGGDTSSVYIDLGTIGSATYQGDPIGVADGEYYRLVTGAFLHDPANPLHILFNMYILYWLGTMLEPVLGHIRFVALYFASLLAGSFGALVAAPHSLTVGASGAVFGLMAGAFIFQRARGVDPWRSGLGPVILFNLALPFLFPNLNISIGAHVGGLIGGAIAALAIEWLSPRRRGDLLPVLACVAVAAVSVVGAISVASG
ncbi:MAG TPA: rhomboid family intramembrane serine protease [Solirubrobacteraceae bacterium]|jgi:membrane associated rhomboid family serine protease|nr:rhomboid family intramembrane serine protease [Solirubrobacteraceae bacterium]